MRALITGHKGFVGRHVVPKLIEAGYEIHGTENLEYFLHSPLASSSWDVVIHLAANIVNVHDRGQIGMCAFDDLALDMKVFNWVERNPPRRALVVMSSCALDFPEDPYCIVKRTVEAFAACLHQQGVPVVILRPFSGYGGDQSTNLTAGRDREALVALELANPEGESAALREHLRGDALHNLGLLKEARLAYRKAIKLTGSDPLLESKLGYTEVRLGHKQPGIAKLVRAVAAMPDVCEIHERLIKAYIVAGMLAEAAETADKLTILFATPETFLRAASIRAQLEQWQHTEELLSAGLKMFPQSTALRNAYGDLERTKLRSALPVS